MGYPTYVVPVEFWTKYDYRTGKFNAHRRLKMSNYTIKARNIKEAKRKAFDKALDESTADIMERFTVFEPELKERENE